MINLQALVLFTFLFAWAWPSTALANVHFDTCHDRTGNNATVIVPATAIELDGSPLAADDEIAVFTPQGVCAGHLVWDGNNAALAIWEDDPSTDPVEGFVPGEPMRYVVWDASTNTEYGQGVGSIEVSYDAAFNDDGVFDTDAIYLVSEFLVSTVVDNEADPQGTFALEPNFPNPFSGRTTIQYELAEDARVRLEVYNLLGHRVGVLVDGHEAAGRHEVEVVAGSDWASGVYVYRLQAGRFTSHRKMVLVN